MNIGYVIGTMIAAAVITALLGLVLIPFLRKLKFGQTILDIGPKWHKSKQGTPTMGGIMFIIGTLLAIGGVVAFIKIKNPDILPSEPIFKTRFTAGIFMAIAFAAIGFIDDYIKVVKKQNLGLTELQKTILQVIVTIGYLFSLGLSGDVTTYIPFLGDVNLGIFYWILAFITIYGFVNAVNLTDGIDGLASSVTLVVGLAFMVCALNFEKYAHISLLAAALVGGCAGFLLWNFHPAKVFMGDTGSMFLGGMVMALAFGINRPILIFPIGIIYLIEAFSVVIQVTYYKRTKKRLFKMTPIHHHFEMSNWSEYKIVGVFSFVTVIGSLIGIASVIFGW